MNFCLALHAKSSKAFDFVSGNLGMIHQRTVQHANAKCRVPPIINRTNNELVALVVNHVESIRAKSGDRTMRIAFSFGFDATVVVNAWQVIHAENVVVGGASPNHWLAIGPENKDDITAFYELCCKGLKRELAEEAKIAVVSFQQTPPGITPYLIVKAVPQTVNESNSFVYDVMSQCVLAAEQAGNTSLLNDSTDGVSPILTSNVCT